MKQHIIAQGAEAVLTRKGSKVLKDRIPKGYRHPDLDNKLRKRRTKSETKLLTKANKLITAPKILSPINNKYHSSDNKTTHKYQDNKGLGGWAKTQDYKIIMQYIPGKRLSDHLDNLKNYQVICRQIGKNIALLHDAGLIHGDLTTSNMILSNNHKINKKNQSSNSDINNYNKKSRSLWLRTTIKKHEPSDSEASDKVFFIDFGLGFHSDRIEDKAVDLHLIKQALEAKHHRIYEKAFKAVLQGYKISKNYKQTLTRLQKVERRGRYKSQY